MTSWKGDPSGEMSIHMDTQRKSAVDRCVPIMTEINPVRRRRVPVRRRRVVDSTSWMNYISASQLGLTFL